MVVLGGGVLGMPGYAHHNEWKRQLRDALADLIPEKASTLRTQNCCNAVQLQFQRLTLEADVKWVKTNINQATPAYHEGPSVTFGTKSIADQREAVQLLKGLKDGKQLSRSLPS